MVSGSVIAGSRPLSLLSTGLFLWTAKWLPELQGILTYTSIPSIKERGRR